MNNSGSTSLIVKETESATPAAAVRTGVPSAGTITSVDSLREHLQYAIELEHSTIPPYLCALYSIEPGRNLEAVEVITSVVVEEMLHLMLAANLLNAVGGRPRLDIPQMLPGYPRPLPHSDRSFEISLFRFGPDAIESFLKIEQPAPPCGPPEGDCYETIGQFYESIKQGVRNLSVTLGEASVFCGDPARQVTDEHIYSGGGGHIITVNNLDSALAALEEIVEQGEGANHAQVWDGDSDVFHPERDQVAHYYRFQELKLGRRYRCGDTPRSGPTGDPISIDWNAVRLMRAHPRTSDHAPGSPIRIAQDQFNHSYCSLLRSLEEAFNGVPQMLGAAIGAMYTLKALAQTLMQMPTEDGLATAGPTFEYVAPDRRASRP